MDFFRGTPRSQAGEGVADEYSLGSRCLPFIQCTETTDCLDWSTCTSWLQLEMVGAPAIDGNVVGGRVEPQLFSF
jgi:hypothetical protein